MSDYVIRYGNETNVKRSFYDEVEPSKKFFEKLKKDNNVLWAELIYEPLDSDEQIIVDSFEKEVINLFGKKVVINK